MQLKILMNDQSYHFHQNGVDRSQKKSENQNKNNNHRRRTNGFIFGRIGDLYEFALNFLEKFRYLLKKFFHGTDYNS